MYLDTNAWNALCDWSLNRSLKWLSGPEYLFSSCNLDEFSLAPSARAKQLAALAWRLSNRKKLLDHVELTAAEVAAYRGGKSVDYFDGNDRAFPLAWSAMRTNGVDVDTRAAMHSSMDGAKREYLEHLQLARNALGPFFRDAAKHGTSREWPDLMNEMAAEQDIRRMLALVLNDPALSSQRSNIAALDQLDYRVLPGTACWVQYHLAISFLAAQKTGKVTRPDLGDQVDFRHACYAGVVDVFVTGDQRMHQILSTMISPCSASVLSPEAFLEIVSS